MKEPIHYYGKHTCSKCRRTTALLREIGAPFIERDYTEKPLSAEEIRQVAGPRSMLDLINPERDAYKERGFDVNPPTEDQALQAMVEENNLVRRPILVRGDRMTTGWDEERIRSFVSDES